MKQRGCNNYFREEFRREILKAYERISNELNNDCSIREVSKRVANEPAPRFYVTARRAIDVVSRMHRMLPMDGLLTLREEMYADIYERALKMMHETGRSLDSCVARVIVRPAPKFYVTPGTVRNIVSQETQRRRREARRKKFGYSIDALRLTGRTFIVHKDDESM